MSTSPENPIIAVREIKGRWRVTADRPAPDATSRMVYVDKAGRRFAPERPATTGEMLWRGIRHCYEVDVAEHQASFACEVPCKEKGFYFDAHVTLRWRVHDPDRIVADGRRDVRPVYEAYLVNRMAGLSEQYSLENRLDAERALAAAIAEKVTLPEGVLLYGCTVRLTVDDRAEAQFRSRTTAEFDKESREQRSSAFVHEQELRLNETTAANEVERLRREQELRHQVAELQAKQQIAELQRQLKEMEQRHQLELDRVRRLGEAQTQVEVTRIERDEELRKAEHDMALEARRSHHGLEIKIERVEFYRKELEGGNVAALIPILLEESPDTIGQVVNLMLAQHRDNIENNRKILQAMLEASMVNGRDLDETRRTALRNILEGLSTGALAATIGEQPKAIDRAAPGQDPAGGAGGGTAGGEPRVPGRDPDERDQADDEDDDPFD